MPGHESTGSGREEGGQRRAAEELASRINSLLEASVRNKVGDAEDGGCFCDICRDSGVVKVLGNYAMMMLAKSGKYVHVRWQREASASCRCDYGKAKNEKLKHPLAVYDPNIHVRVSNRDEDQINKAIEYWRRKRGEKSERKPKRDV